MALKTEVKVSNITNLSEARYCAGMGVDMVGFPVKNETIKNDLRQLQDITSWISGPRTVIEWSGAVVPQDALSLFANYNVAYLEVDVSLLESLSHGDKLLIVRIDKCEWPRYKTNLLKAAASVAYVLLTSGDNVSASEKLIEEIAADFDVLLGSGIDESTVDDILKWRIKGIALQGTHEEKPGMKEYSSLTAILEKLEMVS